MIVPQIQQILVKKHQQIRAACKCDGGCQKCARRELFYTRLAEAQLPTKFWNVHIKDFTWDEQASTKVKAYINKMAEARDQGIGLYMWGKGGVGKTLGAALILKEAIRRRFTARFTTLSETITLLSDGLYDRDVREQFHREVLEVDFLILDDIDKTYRSDKTRFMDSQTDTIFRQRTNCNLPIIVTSNRPRTEFVSVTDNTGDIDMYGAGLLELFAEHLIDIVFTKTRSYRQEVNAQKLEKFLGE